jgi:ComF family protein
MVYNWMLPLLPALYPTRCLLCGTTETGGAGLCVECENFLPRNEVACARCALPLPSTSGTNLICGNCQKKAPPFDQIIAPFYYLQPLNYFISEFKFQSRLVYGRLLADLMLGELKQNAIKMPDLLLPVPLHKSGLRQRGFNQSSELCRHLSKHLSIPWSPDLLLKHRETVHQRSLKRKERKKNISGSFRYLGRKAWLHVALVDDVVTTGATVEAAATVLKAAGVQRVDVWAVCRTPKE